MLHHVFGPVFSRRLGRSLGVDPVPFKTCNLNCIYCQLGPTPPNGKGWSPIYPPVESVLHEVSEAMASVGVIDHVTVSGSGEPTLHRDIENLLSGIKSMTRIPVAVITNGTLLSAPDLRRALGQADVVLPSLDAAENPAFNRISRPPGGLDVEEVIAGLVAFRQQFTGQLWLEVLLVHGINDTPYQVACLKTAITRIRPDRIHLNTVIRPPATNWALPVSRDRMEQIGSYLGPQCEVITEHPRTGQRVAVGEIEEMDKRIVEAAKRRPMTLHDLAESLGTIPALVLPWVARLRLAGVLDERNFWGRQYYLSKIEDEGGG